MEEFDHKRLLGVAAFEGLAMGNLVNLGKGLWGPHHGRTDVLLEGLSGGSLTDNLFNFRGDGARREVELDWVGAKSGHALGGRREGGVEVTGKVVGVNIQLCTKWEAGVCYGFVLVAFDVGDLRGREQEKGIGDGPYNVPVRFEGGIGVFDGACATGGQACNKTFVVCVQANTGGMGCLQKAKRWSRKRAIERRP
jgi:hypothetical protein